MDAWASDYFAGTKTGSSLSDRVSDVADAVNPTLPLAHVLGRSVMKFHPAGVAVPELEARRQRVRSYLGSPQLQELPSDHAYFSPGANPTVGVTPDLDAYAHEYAHATSPLMPHNDTTAALALHALPAAGGLGAMLGAAIQPTHALRYGLLGSLGSAPQLAEETQASIRARRALLDAISDLPEDQQAAILSNSDRRALVGLGSYAAAAAAPIGMALATGFASSLLRKAFR